MQIFRQAFVICVSGFLWSGFGVGSVTAQEQTGLEISLGLGTDSGEVWDGTLSVSGGSVDRVVILDRGPEDMVVGPNGWRITTYLRPPRHHQPMQVEEVKDSSGGSASRIFVTRQEPSNEKQG